MLYKASSLQEVDSLHEKSSVYLLTDRWPQFVSEIVLLCGNAKIVMIRSITSASARWSMFNLVGKWVSNYIISTTGGGRVSDHKKKSDQYILKPIPILF